MASVIRSFYDTVARKTAYWLPILLIAVLSYGFSIANRTLSIDDMAMNMYTGDGHVNIASLRWAFDLYNRILDKTTFYTPFADKFLGVVFFIFAAFLFCTLLFSLNGKKENVWGYTVFSCVLISAPFINEIWEYNGANMITTLNLSIVCFTILYLLSATFWQILPLIFASILLTPVISSYESSIASYVTIVFIVLLYRYGIQNGAKSHWYSWILDGLYFAVPLVFALILRLVIGFALMRLNNTHFAPTGAVAIGWGTASFRDCIRVIIQSNLWMYFTERKFSTPVRIFNLATVLFIGESIYFCLKKKSVLPAVISVFLYVSLFSLAIIQAGGMQYRTAQTIHVFVAFAAYILVSLPWKYAVLCKCLVIAMLFLSFRQALFLNWIFALNNQRSDNEAAIAQQIGFRLYSEFDREKPVVFTGKVSMGKWVNSQRHEETVFMNVNSVINWSNLYYKRRPLADYFSYYGYDILIPEKYELEEEEYLKIAHENNMKPYEILDMGDYILIYLGELLPYESAI